ncbi:unnamed protein product [Calypogeia fissa]
MLKESFATMQNSISKVKPLLRVSESEHSDSNGDNSHHDLLVVVSSSAPGSAGGTPRALRMALVQASTAPSVEAKLLSPITLKEIARQSVPDQDPPLVPFVTTSSGLTFVPQPIASTSEQMDIDNNPTKGPKYLVLVLGSCTSVLMSRSRLIQNSSKASHPNLSHLDLDFLSRLSHHFMM